MFRAVCEIRPRWVLAENVRGIINCNAGLVFEKVQTDLESEGYHVWPFVLPAAGVGAPHRRERVWFIAYRHSDGPKSEGPPEKDHHRDRKSTRLNYSHKCAHSLTSFHRKKNIDNP